MKTALLPFSLFAALSASAMTVDPSLGQQEPRCGDSLLCYFSNDEIQSALGGEGANPLVFQVGGERAPVWGTFMSNFRKCAPGCVPADYETFGKRGHASCHNTGRAIDVGAIVCGGVEYKAVNGGRFTKFVDCMKSKMKTLYHNGRHVTRGHRDHVHFSMGCVIAGGRNYY